MFIELSEEENCEMLSTLRCTGSAANLNSLVDPNSTFDPTLSHVSGEEAARDVLIMEDVPKQLFEVESLEKKPQEIRSNCLFEKLKVFFTFTKKTSYCM